MSPEPAAGDFDPAVAFGLEGKVALVTGAGRGIGRGCALALADVGAELVLVSRTGEELDRVRADIERAGGRARALVCDVTDASAVERALAGLERVDVLVNSAGTNIPEPFLDVSAENLDALWAVNVRATFLVSQAVARTMVDGGEGGAIVHVSSQMGHVGAAKRSVYCTTKHAIEGLTKAMAVELADHRIRVNAVGPTFVETPMTRGFFEEPAFREEVLSKIPLGRVGQISDVVGAVVYLASPAAELTTGASLVVDGGWTSQ